MNIRDIIESGSGSVVYKITTESEERLSGGKKNDMQGRVKKRTIDSIVKIYNGDFESVFSRLMNEEYQKAGIDKIYEPKQRTWGERIKGTPFIEHKDEIYVEVFFVKSGRVVYLLDDKEIDKSDIVGLKESTTRKFVGDSDSGEFVPNVIVRTYKLNSIKTAEIVEDYQDEQE